MLDVIYNEDCLETMKRLPENSIDLLLTDPPYEIHAKSGGGLYNKSSWLAKVADANLDTFSSEIYFNEWLRVTKSMNGYIFTSKALLETYISLFEQAELRWDLLIYAKNNPIPTKNNKYLSDKEYCFFVRGKNAYFDNDRPFSEYKTVQYVNVTSNKNHPTEKDLGFIKLLINKSSKPGDVVYDPFMGSGTTARACKDLGRHWIGSEISVEYCRIAEERLGQEVLFGGEG